MPTKQELETINDELLTENEGLRRASAAQMEQLATLTATLQIVASRLETVAEARQPESASSAASSRDKLAAQIEPSVAGLKGMIEAARQQTTEQNKRAQYLQTMLDRNEQTNQQFLNKIGDAREATHRLNRYLIEWSGQPRITVLKIASAMFVSILLAGVLIVFYASWRLSPTRRLIEDATKWQVLTETMPPERIREIEQGIENKLYQREQNGQIGAQTTGASPTTSAPAPSLAASSPTPPPQSPTRRSRR